MISDRAYFKWLCNIVCDNMCLGNVSYEKLLRTLYDIEFTYLIPKDENRYKDGIDMRYRYYYRTKDISNEHGPCNVLEMMLALAIGCEEDIMDDPEMGDRTSQWFWEMVTNLGLGGMSDDMFDERYVRDVIQKFLDRKYERDGTGGLFRVRNCKKDLRKVEIWHQLCWYLDTIV